MAELNVFELTNAELNKCLTTESKSKKSRRIKKRVTESNRRRGRKKFIPSNKIRVESLSKYLENDGEVDDYTPEDDVVLVVDPEMEETPETAEDAETAAEELVGSTVCKCAVCGANYICDHTVTTEDLESEEQECPVCGETGEQIVVGEIAAPEAPVEDEAEDDSEDFEDIPDDDTSDDDTDYEESINRAKRRTKMRRESTRRNSVRRNRTAMENRQRRPMRRSSTTRRTTNEGKEYNFDEVTLNRMLTQFAKENYDNVRFVKIAKAKCRNGRLTLEGTVTTKKGSKRTTKFVCENFRPESRISARFTEIGAFTENATTHGPSFTIDFRTMRNTIRPVSLKYNYNVKENRNTYQVKGSVLSERVKSR